MYKRISLLLFLATYMSLNAQNISFYFNSSYPAQPVGGLASAKHLIESQMIYPELQLGNKEPAVVFIDILVDWEGNVSEISSNAEPANNFSIEALRLVQLLCWKKDEIRKGKTLESQQIKIEFNAKKYYRINKKRKINPSPTIAYERYSFGQLDSTPSVLNAESISSHMAENFNYPALALQREISGKVTVQFVIETNGMASNFNLITALAGGCNEETIRLLKLVQWTPARRNGKIVRANYKYTLNFNHPGNTYR